MNIRRKNKIRNKRIQRVRLDISGTSERPRLAVYRSLRHIYAQIIDDTSGKTLVSFSTEKPEIQDDITGKKKTEQAAIVGDKLGQKAKEAGIETVVFDRHGMPYMGRIKALAEAARKAGLKF